MCDALRGRCAAEEILKDKPSDDDIAFRWIDLCRDDDVVYAYLEAWAAVMRPYMAQAVALDAA